MPNSRIAVVTGGNKGIGKAIVKEICKQFDGIVYLTARDVNRGNDAVADLKVEGISSKFHQLDIDDETSIMKFKDYIKNTYGGLDILVNNAAIAYKADSTVPFGEQAETTIRTNLLGTLSVCNALFPLLRPHARVVNLSSSVGMLKCIKSPELQQKFLNSLLTEDELCDLMNNFVTSALKGQHLDNGWGPSAYSMSKVAVTALSMIQQRKFDKDSRVDIIVNAVHPGYVDTDMTSHRGPLTVEQGAEAPVYLALLPADVPGPKGQMVWNDKKVVEWL